MIKHYYGKLLNITRNSALPNNKEIDKLHIELSNHFYEIALHTVSFLTGIRKKTLYLIIKDGVKLHIEQFMQVYEKALHMVSLVSF